MSFHTVDRNHFRDRTERRLSIFIDRRLELMMEMVGEEHQSGRVGAIETLATRNGRTHALLLFGESAPRLCRAHLRSSNDTELETLHKYAPQGVDSVKRHE